MMSSERFLNWLSSAGINLFVGVPDSLLANLLDTLQESSHSSRHIIAANEGAAVAYGIGSFLESGRPPAVYFQNSGLGNAINPLISLAHHDVYGTPILLIIGWRGKPGLPDEPQHLVQGNITLELLDVLGIPHTVLDSDEEIAAQNVKNLLHTMVENSHPVAIVVPAGSFGPGNSSIHGTYSELQLSREDALALVMDHVPTTSRIIATTGMLGRELWELRNSRGSSLENDFLAVGGMGHASSIAHGVAEENPDREVWCLDGDGALIMHMGTLSVIGQRRPPNLRHVVFNNFSHDSVGGLPTSSISIDFPQMAASLGYRWSRSATDPEELATCLADFRDAEGPALLEIRVRKGARKDLGRPSRSVFSPGTRFTSNN